jgi:TatD DNase family protein
MVTGTLSSLTDTHCHLDFQAFDGDREAVLDRAREAGLVRILVPGIDLPSSLAALRLAKTHSELYAAVGIHPNEWGAAGAGALEKMRDILLEQAAGGNGQELSQSSAAEVGVTTASARTVGVAKLAAIGEIGLDYYRDRTPREQQRQGFLSQLELAAELSLPVVIHNRQASVDLIPILVDWQSGLAHSGSPLAERPGVLHSFSEDLETAEQAIRLNFSIGFTGPVTFRNASALQEIAARLPLERILVETDSPFLAPQPFRGQRNEPAHVRLVAAKIASLQTLPFAQVAEITTANAGRLFQW